MSDMDALSKIDKIEQIEDAIFIKITHKVKGQVRQEIDNRVTDEADDVIWRGVRRPIAGLTRQIRLSTSSFE